MTNPAPEEAQSLKKVTQGKDKSARIVTRTIWYKRVLYPSLQGEKFSLEAAIRRGLELAPDFTDRRQELSRSNNEILILNENEILKPAGVCCRLMLFELDSAVEIGKLDQKGATIPTEFYKTENGREVCTGTCHFFVMENHVVVIASRSVRWRMLAVFLNDWLTRLAVFPKGWLIDLRDVLPAPIEEELRKVKRVEIEADIDWQDLNDPEPNEGRTRRLLATAAERLGALGLIKGSGVSMRDATAETPFHAKLILERRGAIDEDELGFMEQVARAVRKEPEGGAKWLIRYGDKGKLTELATDVSDPIDLPSSYGNPQFRPAMRAMITWLEKQLLDGRIKPSPGPTPAK